MTGWLFVAQYKHTSAAVYRRDTVTTYCERDLLSTIESLVGHAIESVVSHVTDMRDLLYCVQFFILTEHCSTLHRTSQSTAPHYTAPVRALLHITPHQSRALLHITLHQSEHCSTLHRTSQSTAPHYTAPVKSTAPHYITPVTSFYYNNLMASTCCIRFTSMPHKPSTL